MTDVLHHPRGSGAFPVAVALGIALFLCAARADAWVVPAIAPAPSGEPDSSAHPSPPPPSGDAPPAAAAAPDLQSPATAPAVPGPLETVPGVSPAPAAAPAISRPSLTTSAPARRTTSAPAARRLETADDLSNAGYLPGYRTSPALSLSPYSPRVGALPGGVTPGFAAPMPASAWQFRWTGLLSATFQSGINRKADAVDGSPRTVFHIPPQPVDEYASFVGTSTMPGQWVALNFEYGNRVVTAHVALNTWNPSDPTTYYQIGSQSFINNAFLQFEVPISDRIHLQTLAGYFYAYYGNLGQYTPGMYTNPITGTPRGVGETSTLRYAFAPRWNLELAHGFLGNRVGKVPDGVVPTGGNASASPIFAASWVNHLHVALIHEGEATIRTQLHWLVNWAADDRVQRCAVPGDPSTCVDDPTTRGINEAYIPDGRIDVVGADTTVQHPVWGYLAGGAAFVRGKNAFPLRGLQTFGGEGQTLTDRWFGDATGGTGKLWVAGMNYSASLGRIRAAPAPFAGEGPDVVVNAGVIVAYTTTHAPALSGTTGGTTAGLPSDADLFNRRLRYKAGADVLYTFSPYVGAGVRVDRVAPNSKDSGETFYVVAPRIVLKTSWQSRESITLLYAKWFYGPRTHADASSLVPSDIALDDQLIALNVNMWW